MTSAAQKRAQTRYDAKRPAGVLVRLDGSEMRVLDSQRGNGESRTAALKRLSGLDCTVGDGLTRMVIWAYPSHRQALREYADALRRARENQTTGEKK